MEVYNTFLLFTNGTKMGYGFIEILKNIAKISPSVFFTNLNLYAIIYPTTLK